MKKTIAIGILLLAAFFLFMNSQGFDFNALLPPEPACECSCQDIQTEHQNVDPSEDW